MQGALANNHLLRDAATFGVQLLHQLAAGIELQQNARERGARVWLPKSAFDGLFSWSIFSPAAGVVDINALDVRLALLRCRAAGVGYARRKEHESFVPCPRRPEKQRYRSSTIMAPGSSSSALTLSAHLAHSAPSTTR